MCSIVVIFIIIGISVSGMTLGINNTNYSHYSHIVAAQTQNPTSSLSTTLTNQINTTAFLGVSNQLQLESSSIKNKHNIQ